VQGPPQPTDGIRLDPSRVPKEGLVVDLEHDAGTLVIAFAGLRGFLGGFPAFEFRNILSSVDVKSAFFRDHYAAWYHRGVVDVGPGIDSVLARLRELQREARRVVMIGNSAGGYAALLFAALLGCEAYVFSPQTFIDPDLLRRTGDTRWDPELAALLDSGFFDQRYGDLAPLLEKSDGRFEIFYGALDPVDWKHAEPVRELDQVTVNRIEDSDHQVVRYLRDSGWLLAFLRGMASEQSTANG
jgi:pimeloyl-ACP methyl ester carboxylesterase